VQTQQQVVSAKAVAVAERHATVGVNQSQQEQEEFQTRTVGKRSAARIRGQIQEMQTCSDR
jgi:hypothetical protein